MSKRTRFLIVLVVIVGCLGFLYPTVNWHFLKPQWEISLSENSSKEIEVYSKENAGMIVSAIKDLNEEDPAALLVDGLKKKLDENSFQQEDPFDFLIDIAKERYKSMKIKYPSELTVDAFIKAFPGSTARSFQDMSYAVETYYREFIFALKDYGATKGVLQLGLDLSGGMNVVLEADIDSLAERLEKTPTGTDIDEALDMAMERLNSRIDKFGLTEPSIRRSGDNKIEIEIPGSSDKEIVSSFLNGKGNLKFKIVEQDLSQQVQTYFSENPDDVYDERGDVKKPDFLGDGFTILGWYEKDSYGNENLRRWFVVLEDEGLDGEHIKDAEVGYHPIKATPVINFVLDTEGGNLFLALTTDHEGEPLAVVLDDKIRSVATINEPISQNVQMEGFDQKEASDLAKTLRTGAMPIDLQVNSQTAVGASLGEDSIRQGLNAILIGFLAIVVFMLIYYKGAGFVADVALFLNIVFILAILSAFGLTLTLTSIAGLILTVGMAVDANVIIFERIKEEYRLGKSADASIKAGFKKAFWTIMDANITTFIAAIFLSQLGTGAIQGFAYTLAVGIVSSMFTALFVSRLMFDFGTETLKLKKLSIAWRLK